ncbi:MAG: hypothetical protein IJS93_00230 [Clostridia bacterium]|nr:hypothetical protein [Clostridia bacterium]
MKGSIRNLLLIALFIVTCAALFIVLPIGAKAEDDVEIAFYINGVETTPTMQGDKYVLEYQYGMTLRVEGRFTDDREATSSMSVKVDDKYQETAAIYNAGEYDVRVSLTYDGTITSRNIKLTVAKKTITDISFDEPIKAQYGVVFSPTVYFDENITDVEVTYEYYTDSSKTVSIVPVDVGKYYVEAVVSGTNYYGVAGAEYEIVKAYAEIKTQINEIQKRYSYAEAGEGGYSLQEAFGITIENAALNSDYLVKSYVLKDGTDEYVYKESITEIGYYSIYFAFSGKESNYYYYKSKEVTFELLKADVSFERKTVLSAPYDEDKAALDVVKKAYTDGNILLKNQDGSVINSVAFDQLNVVFYEDETAEVVLAEPSNEVGRLYFTFSFEGNSFYNACESAIFTMDITKRDISGEIYSDVDFSAFSYGAEVYLNDKYTIPAKYVDEPSFAYFSVNENKVVQGELDALPSIPGRYAMRITVTDGKNYEGSAIVYFIIRKVKLSAEQMTVSNLSLVYGSEVNVLCSLPSEYKIKSDEYSVTFYRKGIQVDKPITVGDYDVKISVDNAIYTCDVEKKLTISKKDLYIKALDRLIDYGDDFYKMNKTAYPEDAVSIVGLVEGDDKSSILSSIKIYALVGGSAYSNKDSAVKVGVYKLNVRGETDNYNIVDDSSGELTVNKREIKVRVADVEQFLGKQITPKFTITNCAYADAQESESLSVFFECYYTDEEGKESFNEPPTEKGRYRIIPRIKKEFENDPFFDNYRCGFISASLNLLDNKLSTSISDVEIEGNFTESNLTINKLNADKTLQNAVKNASSKYVAKMVLNVPYSIETADNTAFVMYIDYAATSDTVVLFGYNNSELTEVPYVYENGKIKLAQKEMGTYYVICEPKTVNKTMVIIIAAAVTVAVVIFIVCLVFYLSGRGVKAKKREEQLVSTGIAPVGNYKSEDEELDEFIENFDESTVQKTEMPAERIAQKEKDELREQYRLRLRRMRTMGDKSIEDQIRNAGINPFDTMFDEEEAIDKMIAADEENKRIREEADRKLKEEQEKEQEKATTFTIKERQSGTLSSGATAAKPKRDGSDDFDI